MMSDITDIDQRIALLKNLCLFAHISQAELTALALLFNDVVYPANTIIVGEHEIIDSVYLIVEGKAEVSRQNDLQGVQHTDILEILSTGESIGLDDTGFFSQNSLRTATVTAVTPVFAIRLELKTVKKFFATHPAMFQEMQKEIDNLITHAFIKKLEPFAEISHSLLEEITPHITAIDLPAETIIFREGEPAECCYLLCSGKVDVTITKSNGTEKNIATIESGELLGEMALYTENKRNATLKTITPCKLLVIQRNEFQQLVQHAVGASDELTAMLMDRYRPLQCQGFSIHTREDAEKNTIVILKNNTLGTYVKMSTEGLFVWHLLDGEHTLQDIAVTTIGNLVMQLMQSGFVKSPMFSAFVPQTHLPRWMRALAAFRNMMQYEYSIKNVDAWITRLYQCIGYIFFTRLAIIGMSLIALIGFSVFVGFLSDASAILKVTPNAWILLLLTGPANILAVPLHELAHALATKFYGLQVNRLGVGWFWLGPVAFADTSDMWLSTRKLRIVVNLAGIYINLVILGILAHITICLPNHTIAVFIWLTALSSYLMAFYNLDPMFELDGYYVLMDALDKPNLRMHAIRWLLQDFKKTLFSLTLIRQYSAEIIYWIMTIGFIFLATFMAYIIQTYVLNNVFISPFGHTHWFHYKWLLSSVVIVLSFASLYSKVKQQSYHLAKH